LWDADPATGALDATRAATAVGYVLAADLVACGIDLSFTPVLDLDHGPSGVIGDRAFHRDPRVVALLAKSLMHGLATAGMANCGKHFPGHGHVAADSHVAVPVDERDLDAIVADDAAPYGWLEGTLASVMPAHVVYPRVDAQPAGFSRVWLQDLLRGRFRFEGAIFSDDLSMEGASVAGDVVSAGRAALDAGCDMVLVCNDGPRADALLEGLTDTREPASRVRLAALRAVAGDRRDGATYRRALATLAEADLIER
jgi:beta-N-acetylhexosaminidase